MPKGAVGRRLALTDLGIIVGVVLLAEFARFGDYNLSLAGDGASVGHVARLVALACGWVFALRLFDSYDARMLGHGPEEYRSVIKATFFIFGSIAIGSYVLKLEVARGYVVVALPVGLCALLVGRWLWRKWLVRHRIAGRHSSRTIVTGTRDRIETVIRSLHSNPGAGYHVIGVCPTDDFTARSIGGVPVLGRAREASLVARSEGADVVAVVSHLDDEGGLRNLSWQLEGTNTDLIVVPGLVDVAGPRVRTRPMDGHALLLVEQPVFSGPRLFAKTMFDRVGAAILIGLLSPVFAVLAFLVWRQDRGPVFFRQERVGLDGKPFRMTKFRSMVVNAEKIRNDAAWLASTEAVNEDSGPLVKIRNDPRITPLGTFLRKYSLDELPQLFDVLRGDMSLVGPRPPLPSEVAVYDADVRRRLLVKPGMTGLWQINGRSELSWEESVRFDLYYVENWSIVSDLIILGRTGKAVLAGSGAY
ncbi:sugar transferase [Granulicoccus sp. GXG6511]|uniref:sugar transferase n=1 Tax=Granulicoccus sp. GXG6511 TaxID=3381351 RepID=UPI003D7EFB08